MAVCCIRHGRESNHHNGIDRRSTCRCRWCPAQGPRRPYGMPERRGRRERRHSHPGLRPVRCSLRVRTGLLPRERPTIERSGGEPRRIRPTRSRCPVAHRISHRRHHRRCPRSQRRRHGVVHGSQRQGAFGDMRGPERQTGRRARVVVAVAIAPTGDRSATGDPQSRPPVLRAVRVRALLGAGAVDRRDRHPRPDRGTVGGCRAGHR
ncbi:hypothetical protein RhoFasSB10_05173 [Rhodococcus fascians]|nr:hypothetical protein [Rhodococcus fascians]